MFNLNEMKNVIEKLPHYQQVLLVGHMITHKIHFTENKNGIFVDISMLNDEEINIIENFICQIKKEDEKFNAVELQKEEFKKQLDTPCNIANQT